MTTLKPFDPVQNLSPEEMLDLLGEAYDENDRLRDLLRHHEGRMMNTRPPPLLERCLELKAENDRL